MEYINKYDLVTQIVEFCLLTEKKERFNEIQKSIYKDERILDILKELLEEADDPYSRQNYIDHLEFFFEYQENGIDALHFFVTISEIQSYFIQLAFGFDDFPKRKQYLLSVPFLIEKRSIKIINDYIESEEYLSKNIASRLYRNLLKACRAIGIEKAFLEFSTHEEKYVNAVNSLIRIESIPDYLKFLNNYKDTISSNQMRNVFHYLQAQFEKNEIRKRRVVGLWSVISGYQSDNSNIWYWE